MTHPLVTTMASVLRIDPAPNYTAEVRDGRLLTFDVSDSWLVYYGGTRDHWLGRHPLEHFAPTPEQAPEWYDALDQVMAGGTYTFPFVRVPLEDGSVRYMGGKLMPLVDQDTEEVVGLFSQATPLDDHLARMIMDAEQLAAAHAALEAEVREIRKAAHHA